MKGLRDLLMDLRETDPELWDIFSRKEEYDPPFLDGHGRFLSNLSRNPDLFTPSVSSRLIENGFSPEIPHGHDFVVCLTHDVDLLSPHPVRHMLNSARSMSKGRPREAVESAFRMSDRFKGAYHNLKGILDLEEDYSAESTFFFLALDKGDEEYSYALEDQSEDLKLILDRGGEIALHGGHETYRSQDQMERMKDRMERVIGSPVSGFRNHFLKFEVPHTWRRLQGSGFEYDATLGFADCIGFRNGMCHPFNPFDLDSEEWIDILEIPLMVMDCTLFDYMKLDIEGAWKATRMLMDATKENMGVFTILWHNTYFTGDYMDFYRKILDYAHQNNAWLTSCEEVYEWWRRG